VQLNTESKMFCNSSNHGEDMPPNTAVCPVCMGHPGTLPVINKKALEYSIMTALALNCQVQARTKFDRKNYFYPDLPKGYQISQFDRPVGVGGWLDVPEDPRTLADVEAGIGKRRVRLTRLHLEEDAAKLTHSVDNKWSLVDYNRSSTPLMEIVTEPDMHSPGEAKDFLKELRLIMRYLKVSDADMEKGHMRFDANISLRPQGDEKLYAKVELKNLNSFNAVERALEYEVRRLADLWEKDQIPQAQSTRGWSEAEQVTVLQRTKEEAHDYRYFPEPDLPEILLDKEYVEFIKARMPELPQARRARFQKQYAFAPADARILTEDKDLSNFTEHAISELKAWLISLEEMEGSEDEIWEQHKKKLSRLVAGWLLNKLGGLLAMDNASIKHVKITPENFAEFVTLVFQNKISSAAANDILAEMYKNGGDPSQIMKEKNLSQIESEVDLVEAVEAVIANNPKAVEDYKKGKENAQKFLLGQTMGVTKGRANPKVVERILKRFLEA
jgi:aspartyl-tRNA(Asn)/glutamyl-tRNA(Gln) amidotransferase subunit B